MVEIFQSRKNPITGETVVFEDDGRAGFAYWWAGEGKGILSDVWLYNRAETPQSLTKPVSDEQPLNSVEYVDIAGMQGLKLPTSDVDVEIYWRDDFCADILVHGTVTGRIHRNEKLGYSAYSSRTGPLAKPLIVG